MRGRMRKVGMWLFLGLLMQGLACASSGRPGQATSTVSNKPLLPLVRKQQEAPPAPDLRIQSPPTAVTKAEPPSPAIQLTQGPNASLPLDPPTNPPAKQVQPQVPPANGPVIPQLPPRVMDNAIAANPEVPEIDRLRNLQKQASEHYSGIDSYIVRMRRREQIGGKPNPEELMLLKFRKQPFSVYFKWLGPEAKGREVVYVKGMYEGKLHTLLAAGDVPLMPAGKRIALAPDSALVRSSSRHVIYQAGIGNLIEKYSGIVDSFARGENRYGTLKYIGPISRSEFPAPCEAVEQIIPPGAESQLPRGGRRLWAFDPVTHLPALIITQDDKGQQVEYYCYDKLLYPVDLDEDDFNPEKMGQPKRSDLPH